MLKLIKIGNLIYQNIEPKTVDENGNEIWNIPQDETELKSCFKDTLDWFTTRYINQKLQEIQEDLPDLVSEKSWLEGVFAARGISPEDVRNATVAVVIGQKTVDEAISELSIPEDLIPDFKRAVEIAKIIAWKEAIWKAEATLEEQVDSMTLEELLQLDVKKLCQDAYAQIPLEVSGD
ncbi:hypothetical protein Theam_0063 [Thermovibrio ammonificans HB-1]|uniref:Uncharacterized protein n=1 Tax=Thermovibrio ammonificans (strain DSM 15698 / JCM 12110 / HB-1) TaxID=648996 RepID=E8T332_THEA1|nr:hypothetical protein [Thermovibrio ammonificans]ADU96037.1 hypothetical protein Theam_0063 [Thermovibrio ammonificans HB-1]